MLEILPSVFENYKDTCSITNIRDRCVTFARNESYLEHAIGSQRERDVWIIIPDYLQYPFKPETNKLKYFQCKYPEYLFTLFHNAIHKNRTHQMVSVEVNCKLHETVVMGTEGLKVVYGPNDKKIQFVHTGKLRIEKDVEIGAYSVIHRGTMDDTIVRQGCKFGVYTNIGHNCDIGENTVMAAGVILNGGVEVGKNCWFGSGSLVKNHVSICDNVVIGMGSVVIKNIIESGIYVGNPAKYLKPITEGWNF
jgi:acetyltransferase-like isoleucine patch superfamily enzyme